VLYFLCSSAAGGMWILFFTKGSYLFTPLSLVVLVILTGILIWFMISSFISEPRITTTMPGR